MNELLTIELKNLSFFSHHGYYAEEQKLGAEFIVNILVSYKPRVAIISSIEETVNYVAIYGIVKEAMSQPKALLETVIMQLAEDLLHQFEEVKKVNVSLTKVHPPIAQFTGSVVVSYSKERTGN